MFVQNIIKVYNSISTQQHDTDCEELKLLINNATIHLVAIVILNWNGRKFLEKFLPSVLASTYANKKIIVADNASTDDSVVFFKNIIRR